MHKKTVSIVFVHDDIGFVVGFNAAKYMRELVIVLINILVQSFN